MTNDHPNPDGHTHATRQFHWKGALAMVGAVIAFYLLREHWNHITGNAVYLILLACPLMHLFGHRHGHGQSGSHHPRKPAQRSTRADREGSFKNGESN
jgi:hypothetical protein